MSTFIELCAGMVSLSMLLDGRRAPVTRYRGGKWRLADDIFDVGGITNKKFDRFIWCEANHDTRRFLTLWSDPQVSECAVDVMAEWILGGPDSMVERWRTVDRMFRRTRRSASSDDLTDAEFCASFFLWRQVEGFQRICAAYLLGKPIGDHYSKGIRTYPPDWIIGQIRSSALNFSGFTPYSIHEDAGDVVPFKDAVVYLDPPYRNTLGYSGLDLSRERVVEIARRWDEAGAHVLISEGEQIDELVLEGWHGRQISDRTGFVPGKHSPEFITTNRPPYGELGPTGILSLFNTNEPEQQCEMNS